MSYEKGPLLYEGKAKKIFTVNGHEDLVWMEFKDSLTAFNGVKSGSFEGKGNLNHRIAALIFRYLAKNKVETHWLEDPSDTEMVCRKVEIIPLEVVVRNRLAGSTAKKFGIEEGTSLEKPLVEFFYKNDDLNDPFMSDDQALMIKAASSQEELDLLKVKALEVNQYLKKFFDALAVELIDFKLEFGRDNKGKIFLADEITPDSCRLWDKETGEKMDKDRFRRDLGKVQESYEEIWNRMSNYWETKL